MRTSIARFAMALGASCFSFTLAREPGERPGFALDGMANAQSDADLAAARKLFGEALADQEARSYAVALEKFQRVQAVRDTQAVRYRIAMCLEALGKLRAALAAYTTTSVAAATDAESASIARASHDKVDALSRRVARVVLTLPPRPPVDTVVKIDGETVQPNAIGTPIVVDPGPHEIAATATGALPFHAQMTLPEGGQVTVDVPLAIPEPPPPPPPPPSASAPVKPVEVPPPSPPSQAGSTTAGVVVLTTGGVLLAGSVALLLVRHAEIMSLEGACPGGSCPIARQDELNSTRNRALLEGPLAVGVGAAGLVAAGIGIYLIAMPGSAKASAIAPWVDRGGSGVTWRGTF